MFIVYVWVPCMYINIYMQKQYFWFKAWLYMCLGMYMLVYMYVLACVYIYMYIYIYIYIYNIERVHADEIKQVRELNATRPGSNELNASSQSNRVTGDWPTLPSNPSHPQASQTTRATSATGQRNGSDVGAPATRVISELNESSLSVLLTDDHISTNRYIVLNDSDIIPCGQIPMSQKQMNVPNSTSASQPNDTRQISGLDKKY